jgi:dTDP-4-amino-4,6-dideoxy-D-galactose acyltransferase
VSPEVVLRESRARDLDDLLPIAASVHTDSRFFVDPGVPRERASELFRLWLRRSMNHEIADVVFVGEVHGRAVSYLTAKLVGDSGSVGLVGVGEAARGRGIGMGMVRRALEWFASRGAREVSVVTQSRNIMAQRVYQRCGFLSRATRLWFHRWFA